MLCAMLGVGLLLWARLIVISNAPRTAVAGDEEPSAAAKDPITALHDHRPPRKPVHIALETQPDRDPFVISERFFPKPTPLPELTSERDKSDLQSVEDEQHVEARLTALVEQFSLDAVFSSAGMAVINGKRYRQGDRVPAVEAKDVSFMLAEVRYRAVVLTYEEHRFDLRMDRPGG
jgi:hypothetical protein